jgi:hypothetical protein
MDGKYVVLSASDKTARMIDLAQAREICVLVHPANVVYALLSENDRFVATASDDWTAKVLEVATGREVWHMSLRRNDFFRLAFNAKDQYVILARGSREMAVELWRPQDLIDRACAMLGRNLTPSEWARLSSEERLQTCPNLP